MDGTSVRIRRDIYCFQASISSTRDSAKNKSPTDSVILDAILMNQTGMILVYACTLVKKKRQR